MVLGALGLAAVWIVPPFLERRAAVQRIRAMGDRLDTLRVRVTACADSLTRERAAFERFNRRVDSLRATVGELEALDPRGVPEDRYDEYMETVEAYNRAVGRWQGRADSLTTLSEACRRDIRDHNILADSLRRGLRRGAEDGG